MCYFGAMPAPLWVSQHTCMVPARNFWRVISRGAKHQVLHMNHNLMLATGKHFENSYIFIDFGVLFQQSLLKLQTLKMYMVDVSGVWAHFVVRMSNSQIKVDRPAKI